jgi:serine/threonine protein kinase
MLTRDTEVSPGQILAGKYRIERVLGRGGMGVVVAARHMQLDEQVALKFLLPEALANQDAVKRFEREARAAVKIKSEHVARVTDVGTLESGSPYMVMEYLSGNDLGEYLHQKGPLSAEEAIESVLQACEAIAEAHSMGIIHRDLKPANLFRIVRADGTPSIKVLDFGISKVQGDHAMTHTSSMMGSPQYMSPEQMTAAKTVDARADIWAMGVILLELLTGKTPFDGDTIPELCVAILHTEAPPLSRFRPELAIDLELVITRALKKNREDRFANIAEFATALAPFGSPSATISAERIRRVMGVNPERGARTMLVGTGPNVDEPRQRETAGTVLAYDARGAANPAASTSLDASNTQPNPAAKNNAPLILSAAAAVLILGAGVFWLLGGASSAETAEESLAGPAAAVPAAAPAVVVPPPAPPPAVEPPQPASPAPAPSEPPSTAPLRPATSTSASTKKPSPVKKPPAAATTTPSSSTATTTAAKPSGTSSSKSLFSDRK